MSRAATILALVLGPTLGCGGPAPATQAQLVFVVQPADARSGAAIAVQVAVADAAGRRPSSPATVSIALAANPTGATLSGTTSVDAVNGVASFADLSLDKAGSGYTLIAFVPPLPPVTSGAFAISSGAPVALAFTTQPTDSRGTAVTPAVQVTLRDAAGNLAANANGSVSLQLVPQPNGAAAVGTMAAKLVDGVATFADLRFDRPGQDYKLIASTSLTSATATSNEFDVQLGPFAAIRPASSQTWATLSGGGSYSWGRPVGGFGGSGAGDNDIPVLISSGPDFVSVSGGYIAACGLTAAGAAYCWGINLDGEVGDGTITQRDVPTAVAGGLTFASLTLGSYYACGLTASGAAYCWGDNSSGNLGDGTTTRRTSPVPVSGALTFSSLNAGHTHACGVTPGGAGYCWGYSLGVGDGTFTDRSAPAAVAGGLTFASIVAGAYHSCGLTTAGAAYCWGDNNRGELGAGFASAGSGESSPIAVAGGLTFASITAASGSHTCALTSAGAAYCWGQNDRGQLGVGDLTDRDAPTPVAGGIVFKSVAAGSGPHTCGLTAAGAAYCWGADESGELGDGAMIDSPVPRPVVTQ